MILWGKLEKIEAFFLDIHVTGVMKLEKIEASDFFKVVMKIQENWSFWSFSIHHILELLYTITLDSYSPKSGILIHPNLTKILNSY